MTEVHSLNFHRESAGPNFDAYVRRLSGLKGIQPSRRDADAWKLIESEPRYTWKIEFDAQGMYEYCVLIYQRGDPHKPVVASCEKGNRAMAITRAYCELKKIEWRWRT